MFINRNIEEMWIEIHIDVMLNVEERLIEMFTTINKIIIKMYYKHIEMLNFLIFFKYFYNL